MELLCNITTPMCILSDIYPPLFCAQPNLYFTPPPFAPFIVSSNTRPFLPITSWENNPRRSKCAPIKTLRYHFLYPTGIFVREMPSCARILIYPHILADHRIIYSREVLPLFTIPHFPQSSRLYP